MSYASLVQQIEYIEHVALDQCKLVRSFLYCEPWEIEGNLKPGIEYQLFVANCESVEITEQTIRRTYRVMCMDIILKDKSNERNILSETEFSMIDFLNYFRNGNQQTHGTNIINPNMDILVDPTIESFKEEFGDWCAGWQGTITFETENLNDPCFE